MSDNRNNRAGNGKHPNSPRYGEKYGKGHVNPYLGAQPRQEDVFREIEERQNAVRRENEQDVRDAFLCSRDIRDKYLTSSMLWDIGLLEDFPLDL